MYFDNNELGDGDGIVIHGDGIFISVNIDAGKIISRIVVVILVMIMMSAVAAADDGNISSIVSVIFLSVYLPNSW